MSQLNIDFMMNMTKDYLGGKIEGYAYCLDFPYELEKRYLYGTCCVPSLTPNISYVAVLFIN